MQNSVKNYCSHLCDWISVHVVKPTINLPIIRSTVPGSTQKLNVDIFSWPQILVSSHQGQLSLRSSGVGKSSTGLLGWGWGGARSPVSGRRCVIKYGRWRSTASRWVSYKEHKRFPVGDDIYIITKVKHWQARYVRGVGLIPRCLISQRSVGAS